MPLKLSRDEFTGKNLMTFTFGEQGEEGTGTWEFDGSTLTIYFDDSNGSSLSFRAEAEDRWRMISSGGQMREVLRNQMRELKPEDGTVVLILRRC